MYSLTGEVMYTTHDIIGQRAVIRNMALHKSWDGIHNTNDVQCILQSACMWLHVHVCTLYIKL